MFKQFKNKLIINILNLKIDSIVNILKLNKIKK